MSGTLNRRRFLRGSLMAGTAAAGFVSTEERILRDALADGTAHPDLASARFTGPMPTGRLGTATISRVVSGGNLMGGWAHARDLLYVNQLMVAYNTEARRYDTLQLLEQGGVNTVQVDQVQVDQVLAYNAARGGRLQILSNVHTPYGQWDRPQMREIREAVDRVVDQGVIAAYVHGGYADTLVEAALTSGSDANIAYLGEVLAYIRSKGLPAGLGSHALEVPVACDRLGITPDFYFKTFHHDRYWSASPKEARLPFSVDKTRGLDHDAVHDNIYDLDCEATERYMLEKEQPWFAFKTLCAGAIRPADGFRFAFEHGADFIVVGMFDFQVMENINLAVEILNSLRDRERPWMA